MQHDDEKKPRDLIAGALDWWHAAGVDHAFIDDPQTWLADIATAESGAPPRPKPLTPLAPQKPVIDEKPIRIGGPGEDWPTDFADFSRWWLTEPSLDPAPPARRVPPLGPHGAELMIVVPMPEDDDEAVLLSGRAGKLLDAMLQAMGLSRDRVYLASALPSRQPAPDWDTLAAQGLRDVILHHIALAAPQRLLILGGSVVSTLHGNDPAKNDANLLPLPQGERALPVAAGFDLEAMLARPALKAGVWKKWLDWTADTNC